MERIRFLKSLPKAIADQVRIGFRLFWATIVVFLLLFGGQVWGQSSSVKSGFEQNESKLRKRVLPDSEQPATKLRETLVPEKPDEEESSQTTGVTNPFKPQNNYQKMPKRFGVKPHVIVKGRQKRGLPKGADDQEENNYSLQIPINSPPLQHSFLSPEDTRFMNQEEESSFEDEQDLKDDYYEQAKRRHYQKGKKGQFFEEEYSPGDVSEDDEDQAASSK